MKLKLTESQYNNLLIYINEDRQAPAPTKISGLFASNKSTAYFSIVKLTQKTKDESEYLFKYNNNKGFHEVQDVNKGTATKGCKTVVPNLDMLIVDDQFTITFTSCQKQLNINNVVGIRLFDENHTKLDEMTFDNTSSANSENLVDIYNDDLKQGSSIGDELYFTTPTKELDGEILNKSSDKLEVEIHEEGKKNNKLLYINLENDGFYEENGNIFFKAIEKNIKKGTESEFNIPIKKFSTSRKSEAKPPEVNDPTQNPVPTEEPTQDDSDKPNATGWRTPEEEAELKAKAKAAYDAILSDPDLQKAFYRKPSFWNLFTAEMKGEKAPGKGIVPTLQLVGDYKAQKIDLQLKGEFINGKQVAFKAYGNTINIYDSSTNELINSISAIDYQSAKVQPVDITDEEIISKNQRILVQRRGVDNITKIILISPTDKENVYLCDIQHETRKKGDEIKGIASNQYIILNPNSEGYKPIKSGNQENKEPQQ